VHQVADRRPEFDLGYGFVAEADRSPAPLEPIRGRIASDQHGRDATITSCPQLDNKLCIAL
jgi:hypothetical protein